MLPDFWEISSYILIKVEYCPIYFHSSGVKNNWAVAVSYDLTISNISSFISNVGNLKYFICVFKVGLFCSILETNTCFLCIPLHYNLFLLFLKEDLLVWLEGNHIFAQVCFSWKSTNYFVKAIRSLFWINY